MTAVVATAPTRVDLAGGTLDVWPLYLLHPGAVAVGVALDRRVWCRVTTDVNGVRLESKDTLAKVEGRDLSELLGACGAGAGGAEEPRHGSESVAAQPPEIKMAAHVLRALGLETGIHVVTHARVPMTSGLGVSASLAVAVAAAAARAIGRHLAPEALWPIVRDAETRSLGLPTGFHDYQVAALGGVVETRLDAGAITSRRVATDPSRVEEHLLLVDSGVTRALRPGWEAVKRRIDREPGVTEAVAALTAAAHGLRGALADSRYADVAALLRQDWEARGRLWTEASLPEIDRVVEAATAEGGAARPCGGGGTVLVWIEPDARPRVVERLKAAGARAVPIRADLLGLSVEDEV